MSSTHLSLYYHFVFSTKGRRRWIKESWEGRLHSYLGGIIRQLGGVAEAIGGDEDHVHILASLKASHSVAEALRILKSSSSGWIHAEIEIRPFDWQEGYGAYTVSRSCRGSIEQYIREQKQHHKKKTFQEEYRDLLRENGIEFDERYLW
jgi:putative transposase